MADGPTNHHFLRGKTSEALLASLMLMSAALLIIYRSSLNFMLDGWGFIIYREEGDVGDFLDPHNEHISLLPVAIYKLFLSAFGMGSAMPLHIFSVIVFLLSVLMLFLYLKLLVGKPAALIGCAVILFFGAAWEDLLWAFQIGFSISMAAGLGALIMLRRQDAFGDRVACLLLVISVISTSLGIPFAIGSVVCLLLQRNNLFSRLYTIAIPAVVYGVWYLGWGHTAESALSLKNAVNAPEYIAQSFSLTVTEVTGLSKVIQSSEVLPSLLVGLLALAAVAWGVSGRDRVPEPLLVAAAIAVAFWGLAALNLAPGRDFDTSRYQFPNAVFLLMIVAGAFEGAKLRARLIATLGLVAVAAIAVNLELLHRGYIDYFKPLSDKGMAGLTALSIARDSADPKVLVGMNQDDSAIVGARAYFNAEDKYGSPAWSKVELLESSNFARTRVDEILVAALPIRAIPLPAGLTSRSCRTVESGTLGSTREIPLPSRRFTFQPQSEVYLAVGRYGDGVTTGAALAEPLDRMMVQVPRDSSDVPWRIGFLGNGEVRVCSEVESRQGRN